MVLPVVIDAGIPAAPIDAAPAPRPDVLRVLGYGPRGLAELAALGPFASLWRTLARHFQDPRLQQLFGPIAYS